MRPHAFAPLAALLVAAPPAAAETALEPCAASACPASDGLPSGVSLLQVRAAPSTSGGCGCGCCGCCGTEKEKEKEKALGPPKLCLVFGDPHFFGFDNGLEGKKEVRLGQGDFWAVKGKSVHIQIHAAGRKGDTAGIALGGPFLKGHLVKAMGTKKVYLDGEEFLGSKGAKFQSKDGAIIGEWVDKVEPSPEDMEHLNWKTAKKKFNHVGQWVLRLPRGVEIWLSKADGMSIIIKMPKDDDQDGACGNFDGDPNNDGWNDIQGRKGSMQVQDADNLFKKDDKGQSLIDSSEPALIDSSDPAGEFGAGVVEGCDPALKAKAEKKCAEVVTESLRSSCVFDICMTKDEGYAGDERLEEALASEAAHDVLVNLGP